MLTKLSPRLQHAACFRPAAVISSLFSAVCHIFRLVCLRPSTSVSCRSVAISRRRITRYFALCVHVVSFMYPIMLVTISCRCPFLAKRNLPLMSVVVPTFVPSQRTVAPTSGSPCSSTTFPSAWAIALIDVNAIISRHAIPFFFISI